MSSVYVLEPPTKGKVVLNTSAGPLDIELWPKEAPKAVRNFVQLCVDGYYNGTIFHRLIKTFMVQGGDPTGTGTGGDTIYGGPFPDEIHSRLRFNHRGVVACANAGTPHSNNSQFFITFDRCDWLDKKNTIFGKITGDTVYNLMKIGDLEADKDDRPVDPPVINSVEVLWNPFDDVVPRNLKPKVEPADDKPQRTSKPKKKLNLLSFGEEAEAEEQAVETVKAKIKSSHDVLRDPRLLKDAADSAEMDPVEARRVKGVQTAVRQALSKKDNVDGSDRKPSDTVDGESSEDEADFEASMRKKVLEKRARLTDSKGAGVSNKNKEKQGDSNVKREAPVPRETRRVVDDSDDEKEEKREKLTLKRGMGSEARAALAANVDGDVQLLTPLEQQRARFKQKKRLQGSRENVTLAKLAQFKNKLAQTAKKEVKETDADDENWLSHELKFERDPTKKDDMARNEDPNQYVVHDPLLEKGKEKFNKEQAKFKKRNREWAGKSLD